MRDMALVLWASGEITEGSRYVDYFGDDWSELVVDENGNVFNGSNIIYEWTVNRGGDCHFSPGRGVNFIGTAGPTHAQRYGSRYEWTIGGIVLVIKIFTLRCTGVVLWLVNLQRLNGLLE